MPIENENFKGEVLLLYRPTEGFEAQTKPNAGFACFARRDRRTSSVYSEVRTANT